MNVTIKLNNGETDKMDYVLHDYQTAEESAKRMQDDAARMASALLFGAELGADVDSLKVQAFDGVLTVNSETVGTYETSD